MIYKVSIEFCMQCNYAPKAASLAEKMLTYFREHDGTVENVLLIPSSGGAFEVTVNGDQIYSKLEKGKFPEPQSIIEEMESMERQ